MQQHNAGGARRVALAAQAYMMYLLTGASCLLIGSSLPQLMEHFGAPLVAVTALSSAYAVGRLGAVYFVGMLAERLGPKPALAGGMAMTLCFLLGMPLVGSIPAAMVCAALGGAGMAAQDAACPVVLTRAFPTHYASAIGAGQAFFGAGCFMPPLVMSFVLGAGLPFTVTYYVFAALAAAMLLVLLFIRLEKAPLYVPPEKSAKKSGPGAALWLVFGALCVFYCAGTNTVNLYTASYAASLGIPAAQAVNVLTAFSLGNMAGSLVFAWVLRRVKPLKVFCVNLAVAMACVGVALAVRSFWALAAAIFFTGVFMGVLFSIAVTLAVGLTAGRAGRAGATVALLSGSADTAAPLLTGTVVTAVGIRAGLWFALGFLGLALAMALTFAGLSARRRLGA